jgi:hypothetical protein
VERKTGLSGAQILARMNSQTAMAKWNPLTQFLATQFGAVN